MQKLDQDAAQIVEDILSEVGTSSRSILSDLVHDGAGLGDIVSPHAGDFFMKFL